MQNKITPFFLLLPLILSSCGGAGTSTIEYVYFDTEGNRIKTLYSDDFFDSPSDKENPQMASFAMAMSFVSDRDLTDIPPTETSHIERFYKKFGYDQIYFSPSYYQPTSLTSCAYSFASKKLANGESAVIVSVCSGGYENEWAANMNIGREGDAIGFLDPAHDVLDALKDYVRGYISGPTNLFFAAYSRGAAILNLACGIVDDEIYQNPVNWGQAEISWGNTYAYLMETPAGSVRADYTSDKFNNIHNYLNINDPIPLLAPLAWGFHALGRKHYCPDRLTDIGYAQKRSALLRALKDVAPADTKYPVDTWKVADYKTEANPSLARFEQEDVIDKLMEWVVDRDTYVTNYEEPMEWIFLFYYGGEDGEYLVNVIKANLFGLLMHLADLQDALALIVAHDYASAEAKILEVIDAVISDEGRTHSILEEAFPHIEPLFNLLGLAYEEEEQGGGKIMDIVTYMQTAVFCHLRSSVSCWMMANDPRYGYGGDGTWMNDGTYYRLAVPNVNTFSLSLKDGTSLLTYENGKFTDSTVLTAEIKDGTLSIYLPKNASYSYSGGSANDLSLYDVSPDSLETFIRGDLPANGTI